MLIPRAINIEVVASSWPRSNLPPAFIGIPSTEDVDVAAVLNLIGVLTTPALSGGASLSELWAFVRYLFAITEDSELRLTREFIDIDPHQKTILSDDFGMGFTMHWLAQKLNLQAACDGRYFIENHLQRVGGVYSGGTAKRGLGKSPDFIAYDSLGKFHVIECKGTQSSIQYRNRQLRDSGMAQKRTVVFPPSVAGERLCAGIFVAGPDGDESSMRIVDPEPKSKYSVKESESEEGKEAIAQGFLAKQLRTAGFPGAAAAVAFPWQRRSIEELEIRAETAADWELRYERGTAEIDAFQDRRFSAIGRDFVGRRSIIELPKPIAIRGNAYKKVEIRQGINRANFEDVRALVGRRGNVNSDDIRNIDGIYKVGENNGRAWMMIGESFYSDMRFRHS